MEKQAQGGVLPSPPGLTELGGCSTLGCSDLGVFLFVAPMTLIFLGSVLVVPELAWLVAAAVVTACGLGLTILGQRLENRDD